MCPIWQQPCNCVAGTSSFDTRIFMSVDAVVIVFVKPWVWNSEKVHGMIRGWNMLWLQSSLGEVEKLNKENFEDGSWQFQLLERHEANNLNSYTVAELRQLLRFDIYIYFYFGYLVSSNASVKPLECKNSTLLYGIVSCFSGLESCSSMSVSCHALIIIINGELHLSCIFLCENRMQLL